jgi:hypothetical protein
MMEAVKKRTFSNIRYMLNFAEISDIELIMVGQGALQNNTLNPADLQVTVTLTQSITESQSWSNSVTVSYDRVHSGSALGGFCVRRNHRGLFLHPHLGVRIDH